MAKVQFSRISDPIGRWSVRKGSSAVPSAQGLLLRERGICQRVVAEAAPERTGNNGLATTGGEGYALCHISMSNPSTCARRGMAGVPQFRSLPGVPYPDGRALEFCFVLRLQGPDGSIATGRIYACGMRWLRQLP